MGSHAVIGKTAILHTEPESPRFAALMVTALLTIVLTPFVIGRGIPAVSGMRHHHKELLLAGSISGIVPILGYTAFSLGYIGYVTTLFKLSTLMTVLWSYILLKEGNIRSRLPASLVMVIGAVLISFGGSG